MNSSSTLSRVLRSLRRSPGFVAIATLSMGVALGLSTTVFAVMDAMTHPEPPFRKVAELFDVQFGVFMQTPPPAPELMKGVAALDVVDRVAEWRFAFDESVMIGGRVGRSYIGHAGPGFFDVLGASPRIGRLFTAADHERADVVVVTDMVWRRDYANRSSIGDANVLIGEKLYPIIGVLPAGTDRSIRGDVFIPEPLSRGAPSGLLIRVKPGVTDAALTPRLREMNDRLGKAFGQPKDRGIRAYIRTLQPDPLQVRDFHRAMIGSAVCILLIACANVAALMLARGMVKRRDYALRLALGARPVEIAREVVSEVGILAMIGCIAGVVVTSWFVGIVGGAMPPEAEWLGFVQPQWSWRVLALAMGAVVTSIAVAGGFPAWMAARTDPAGPLKEGAGGTTGRAGTRFRWLVVAELAIAMTILMSASLMMKSIRQMEAYEFGYPHDRILNVVVRAAWREDSTTVEDEARSRQQALEVIRGVPGVESVIRAGGGGCGHPILMGDRSVEGGASLNLLQNSYRGSGGCHPVSPGFFTTMGLQVVEGRDFIDGDDAPGALGAVILDEKTARTLFPHESAVGRSVRFGNANSSQPWMPVVGVVRNHMLGFDPHPEMGVDSAATVYVAQAAPVQRNRAGQPRGSRFLSFIVRTGKDVDATQLRIARAVVPLTPAKGRAAVTPISQDFTTQLRTEEFLSLVFRFMGLASLLLGAAGLFSVISYVAGQRMREFAVRIALGATERSVVRLVLRDGFLMAVGGTGIGAGFGMWAGFLLWDRMWGVYPVDVEALVVAEAALILVTMAACLIPALKASKSDPLEIIRAA